MSSRSSPLALLVLLISCSATGCGPEPGSPPDAAAARPSVILISLDTLRADHMSLYGYERDTTPYLEQLAGEALVYERAFAPVPWTLPSHMTLLTGLHPREHGVLSGSLALSGEIPMLAERLSSAGYRTHAVHNQGWVHPRHGFGRGFDTMQEHEDAELGLQRLLELGPKLRDDDAPYFVFAHFFDAHSQRVNARDSSFFEPPAPFDTLYDHDAAAHVRALRGHRRWHDTKDFSADDVAALTALYDGGINYLDDVLRRWLETWRAEGLLDDTIVIITADHGEALNQRGVLRGHGGFWQDGLHIPLVLRLPDGERGAERVDDPVALVDVVPTLLARLGLAADPTLAGFDLLGETSAGRVVLAERDVWRGLVAWPRKLIVTDDFTALINLDADPAELSARELSDEEAGAARAEFIELLRTQELGRPRRFPAPEPTGPLTDADLAGLQALGYLDGDIGGDADGSGEPPVTPPEDREH